MEDLERYLRDYVKPAIADFQSNPDSVRHAFIACVVTFHTVDYRAHPKKSASLRQQWNRKSPAFKIVDQVAHAFKHVISGNPQKPKLRAGDVVFKGGAFDIRAFSRGFDVGGVTLKDRPEIKILNVVEEAADFLRQQLSNA